MTKSLSQILVAAAIAIIVWLLAGRDWPLLIMGAVLALSLWVMLYAGSWAGTRQPGTVATRDYAMAGGLGIALGFVISLVGGGPAWWSVGFILAGVMAPSAVVSMSDGSDER